MKKVLLFTALGAMTLSANSQNLLNGYKATDNWNLGISGIATSPTKSDKFIKDVRGGFSVELGKQLTPIIGFGIEGQAFVNTTGSKTAFDQSAVNLLGKINLNSLLGGYHGTPRVFEIEAVAGLGWLHNYVVGEGDTNGMLTKYGLNLNFNLGEAKAWTISLKPAIVYGLHTPYGIKEAEGFKHDVRNSKIELSAGLVYHFGGSNGAHHMTLERAYDAAEVDALNGKINELRSESDRLRNDVSQAEARANDLQRQLDECKSKPEPVVSTVTTTKKSLESVITFRQGRATIDASQRPNVERIAVYLNKYPQAKVSIVGYASPEGSAAVNERIANQRAEAVKNMLIKRYKIAASRIEAKGNGVGDMFSEPDWNRVSICTINEANK